MHRAPKQNTKPLTLHPSDSGGGVKRKVAVVIGDADGGRVVGGVQHTQRHAYTAGGWGHLLDDATRELKMQVCKGFRVVRPGISVSALTHLMQKAARSVFVLHGVTGVACDVWRVTCGV